jgi:hypothetical protein
MAHRGMVRRSLLVGMGLWVPFAMGAADQCEPEVSPVAQEGSGGAGGGGAGGAATAAEGGQGGAAVEVPDTITGTETCLGVARDCGASAMVVSCSASRAGDVARCECLVGDVGARCEESAGEVTCECF